MKLKLYRVTNPPLVPGSSEVESYQTSDGLSIIKSLDYFDKFGKMLHVSVARKDRYPHWDEILEIKEHFFGDIDCMMMLPKKSDYVNIHPNCFHIWQCPKSWTD
jgi:hypothetical protein